MYSPKVTQLSPNHTSRQPQQDYPVYPLPIAPEKLDRAVTLYGRLRLEEGLAARAQEHDSSYLMVPGRPQSHASQQSHSSPAEHGSSHIHVRGDAPLPANPNSKYEGSVLSFSAESPSSAIANASSELISYDGKAVRARRRRQLSPASKAKAALIRHLGSCWVCRSRRVPCPLDHHDMDALERGFRAKAQRPHPTPGVEPLSHSTSASASLQSSSQFQFQGVDDDFLAGISGGFEDSPNFYLEQNEGLFQDATSFGHKPSSLWPHGLPQISRVPFLQVNSPSQSSVYTSTDVFNELHVEVKPTEQTGPSAVENNEDPRPIDWTTALSDAIQAAYEATYGTVSAPSALLSRLYSIFNDGSFLSGDLISDFEEESFVSEVFQLGAASESSSISGKLPNVPADKDTEAPWIKKEGDAETSRNLITQSGTYFDGKWYCECGVLARILTKQGKPMQGKKFWSCSKPRTDKGRCPFFLLADDEPEARNSRTQHAPPHQPNASSTSRHSSSGATNDRATSSQVAKSGKSPKVKGTRSNVHPSRRVIRRLRCHFNARYPHRYCVTRATGNKFHVCAKAGYLTIAHLKQHNKSTHTCSRCTRCGDLFDVEEDQKAHARLPPSQMCQVKPEDEWPGTGQAENINEIIQERIRKKLSARGYCELDESTKYALGLWVSTNITEYVGESATPQDKLELKNWYLIWLALFPGIPVPSHPFYDGPSEASAEDERFVQVFQGIVEDRMARQQMTSIPEEIMDEILERIRETQIFMRAMSQAVQNNNTPGTLSDESSMMNRLHLPSNTPPSVSEATGSTWPRNEMDPPAPKRRRGDSQSQSALAPVEASATNLPILSLRPSNSSHNTNQQINMQRNSMFDSTQRNETNMSVDYTDYLTTKHDNPWSAAAPRFSNLEQNFPLDFDFLTTSSQSFAGEQVPSTLEDQMPDAYVDAINRGWFDVNGVFHFGGAEDGSNG